MKFTLAALQRAIADHIGRDLADSLPRAYRTVRNRAKDASQATTCDQIHHRHLGELLAEALFPGLGRAIADASLNSAYLILGGQTVPLSSEDAETHPLFRDRLPMTLGEALRAPIVSGGTMARLAPDEPRWSSIDLFCRGDHGVRGAAQFDLPSTAGDCRVMLHYGESGPDPAMVRIIRLCGQALSLAGAAVAAGPAHSTPPIGPTDTDMAAAPANAIRH